MKRRNRKGRILRLERRNKEWRGNRRKIRRRIRKN
jgi:hypothetical protein